MKIYTKTGDDGSTGLFGNLRVSKADPRVAAYGSVDEANAAIGFARASPLPPEVDAALVRAQSLLFDVGARLASPIGRRDALPNVSDGDVVEVERVIDALEATLPPLKNFILPGGSEGAARLHLARTAMRRAERAIVALADHAPDDPVDPVILRYVNRLSDLLFVQARATNRTAGVADVPWEPRAAKPPSEPSTPPKPPS